MKPSTFVSLAICLFAFSGVPGFAQPSTEKIDNEKFGKLPPNPLSTWELSGVRTEISIEHFLDPVIFKDRLPHGFAPLTVADAARDSPTLAKWLDSNQKYSGYYTASLLFTSMDKWIVDGTNISEGGQAPFAAWWIWGNATAPLDKMALGPVSLQLAAWYPDSSPWRRKLYHDPTMEFAKVELANSGPGQWRIRLKFKDGEITADCRETGERTEIKYPLPQYSTVLLGGPDTTKYMLYTYYGHHVRSIKGEGQFTGDHPLIRSLSIMKQILPLRIEQQDGWVARVGMYKVPASEKKNR